MSILSGNIRTWTEEKMCAGLSLIGARGAVPISQNIVVSRAQSLQQEHKTDGIGYM